MMYIHIICSRIECNTPGHSHPFLLIIVIVEQCDMLSYPSKLLTHVDMLITAAG